MMGQSNNIYRIGQIVPSSNVTMETEIPAMLRRRETILPDRFSFHSSRMRMQKVTREELANMDAQSLRCAAELADGRMDVMGYACLVAIMSAGNGYHRTSEVNLTRAAEEAGGPCPIVTSAGALVSGLKLLGAKRVALVMPYVKPLADLVQGYIEAEGIEVVDRITLEIEDNLAVGRRDPLAPAEIAAKLDVSRADVVVASACVQMPSLGSIPLIEHALNRPTISAASCTAYGMLTALGLQPVIPNTGYFLSGQTEFEATGPALAGGAA
jgi:maleate isomerase